MKHDAQQGSSSSFTLRSPHGRALVCGPDDPCVMGIVNLTPDSFSDGGRFRGADDACSAALQMLEDGALVLDLGAESTRPGADSVPAEEERARLMPVLEALRARCDAWISIDTSKSDVARAALDAGADMINDVTGLRGDTRMASVVADAGAPVVLMHMRGEPRTMQQNPEYADTVNEVLDELRESVAIARDAGLANDAIVLDPGIGFGKRDEDNRAILHGLETFVDEGYPILLGLSRKSLIGRALRGPDGTMPPAHARDAATVALTADAWHAGVSIHRVHAVRYAVDALRVLQAFGRKDRRALPPSSSASRP